MRVFVAGHGGMVGSAIARRLQADPRFTVITAERATLDLTDQQAVRGFLQDTRPDQVVLAAAKVGGIIANSSYPAQFLYDNLMIQTNVIQQAHAAGVQKLLQLGSSCIYPRDAAQPITEDQLLTGPLEPTNEAYAIAKIAGIKLCDSYNREYGTDYRSLMPSNLYGRGDNFHPQNAHVLPALLARFHDAVRTGAETVTIWGTGAPRREFLHVDDLAAAAVFVMQLDRDRYHAACGPQQSHLNIGTGHDITIRDLATLVASVTGFAGRIVFDTTKPDGTPRKVLDISRITRLGWQASTTLRDGIAATYDWFCDQPSLRYR